MHDLLCVYSAARWTVPKSVSTATRVTLSVLFLDTQRAQVTASRDFRITRKWNDCALILKQPWFEQSLPINFRAHTTCHVLTFVFATGEVVVVHGRSLRGEEWNLWLVRWHPSVLCYHRVRLEEWHVLLLFWLSGCCNVFLLRSIKSFGVVFVLICFEAIEWKFVDRYHRCLLYSNVR